MLPLCVSAFAADVLVFGDSWAEGSADELGDALAPYGLTVAGYGIGGTTADQYANQYPTAIPEVLALHPEATWTWLSMGGNDLFANYLAGNGAGNAALYDANFRKVLDQVASVRPDMRVVSFGYDFVNFEQSTDCIAQAWYYFGTGTLTPTINGYFLADIDGTLSSLDPDYFQYTYVPSIWGTLQAAGGMAGAPDPNYPSPAAYMSDCIHPTSEGYGIIHRALVDAYWGAARPVAGISGPSELCVDETAEFEDRSASATDGRWLLDGEDAGDADVLRVHGSFEMSFTVGRVVSNGAWEDEASMTVSVVDCTSTPGDTADSGQETGDTGDTGRAPGDETGTRDEPPPSEGCGCDSGAAVGLLLATVPLARRRTAQ